MDSSPRPVLVATDLGRRVGAVAAALAPVVRDPVGRGFLEPVSLA